VSVEVPCGGELYFTLGTTSASGYTLRDLAFQVQPQSSCPEVDAGTPPPAVLPAIPEDGGGGPAARSCGCSGAGTGWGLGALFAIAALRRRRARARR
jgi:uncharacterized protein (TIGR03382 family)